MNGLRRHVADLAAQIHSMKVAVETMQRHVEESHEILLRLMAEYAPTDPAAEPPPGQRGS